MDGIIRIFGRAMKNFRLGRDKRKEALKRLYRTVQATEITRNPKADFSAFVRNEPQTAALYGGRTVFDDSQRISNLLYLTDNYPNIIFICTLFEKG